MKKQTAYIFAAFIVVLIILAIVIMWLTGGIGGDKPEATPTPEVETSAPRQTQFVIPTATPQPTEAVPTETPTMTADTDSHSRSTERHGYRLGLV